MNLRWLVMNLRWLILNHVPDPIRLTSQEHREMRSRLRHQVPLSMRDEFAGFAIGFPFVVLWFVLYHWTLRSLSGISQIISVITLWGGVWLILSAISHIFNCRRTYAALRQMGYDLCPLCGYWLRGLGENVKQCPECGAEREPLPSKIDA